MGNVSYTELLGKGQQALSAGNWQQAKKLFNEAVNVNSRGAEAWLGLLLAEEQCYVFEDYAEKRIEYYKSKVDAGKVTLRAYKSHINEMVQKYALGTYLSAERIESEYNSVEAVYGVREAESWRQLRKTAEADWNSSKSLSNAERYAQGYFIDEMKDGKRAYLARFDELAKQAALKETSERKKAEAEIRTLTAEADQRVKNLHAKQKDAIEEDYTSFVRSAYAADDSTKLLIAAVKLESLGGYKDSATRAKRCREKAAEIAGGAESKQRKAEEEQRDLDEAIARRRRDTSTVREKNDLDDEIEKRRREIEEYKRRMLGAEAGETETECKRKAEEEAKRKREAEEAERKRKAEEAAKRKREAEEEEKRRRKAEIDEKLRRMAEEAERPVEEDDDSLAEIFRIFNTPAKGQEQRETTRTSADEEDEDPFDPIFRIFETPPEYEKKQTPNAAPEQRAGEKLLGSEFAIPSGSEAKRRREEEEKRKREAEEAERKRKAEEEAKRKREAEEKAAKDAERLLQEAAERAKRKLLEEEEAKRKKAEEEARRKAEEEARRKREAEEREARRKAAEEEAKRKREEEERRKREKELVEKLLREQDERLRKEEEQNEKLRIESEKKYAARRLEEQKIHKAERAEKRKKSMKYVVAIILIAAILVGVFFVFTKKNSPSNTYPHADSISVADVSREPVPDPNSPEALALEPVLPSPRTLT